MGAAMTHSRLETRRKKRRSMRLAASATLVGSLFAGGAVFLTVQANPEPAEARTALYPAASAERAAQTATSSAWSTAAAKVSEARKRVEEARKRAGAQEKSRGKQSSATAKPPAATATPDASASPEPTTAPNPAPATPPATPEAQTPAAQTPATQTPTAQTPASSPAPAPAGTGVDALTAAQIFKAGPYREPNNVPTAKAAELERQGRTADAALIRQIASQPIAMWLGDWASNDALASRLSEHASRAASQNTTPVVVTYAIPGRDCGGYSAGGLSPAAYLDWNRVIAKQLAGTRAVVLVEPDSIALLGSPQCAPYASERLSLLKQAVDILAGAGLVVYLDAGTSNWAPAEEIAPRLKSAGIANARGFFTNVSSFNATDKEVAYANKLSGMVGGKHYVIDTSRNGAPVSHWCNPGGAALGQNPTVSTNGGLLDALLWVKPAGESDGTCNGGPAAGQWFERYALDLVRNR